MPSLESLTKLNLQCVNPPQLRQDVRLHGAGGAPVWQGDAHAIAEGRSADCPRRGRRVLGSGEGRYGEGPSSGR